MIPIALLEKFIPGIEISHLTWQSSKPNELRNLNPVRGRTGNVTIQKWKIYYTKIEIEIWNRQMKIQKWGFSIKSISFV